MGDVRTQRYGYDSDEGDGPDADEDPDGPLTTYSHSETTQNNWYHRWHASSSLSNSEPLLSGSWAGYADVPNQRPDTDSDLEYFGTVDEDFSITDTDWFECLNTKNTIDDCEAWATIDGKHALNIKMSYSSHAHVPF